MKKTTFSISSKTVPVQDARRCWNEQLNRMGVAGKFDVLSKQPFSASVHKYEAENFWFNLFRRSSVKEDNAPACTISCSRREIIENRSHGYSLMVAGKNGFCLQQRGKELDVQPGCILLLNRSEPYAGFTHAEHSVVNSLNLKERFIKNWLPPHIFEESLVVHPNADWARPLSEAMNALDAPFLDTLAGNETRFAESMCCLLSLALQKNVSDISSYKASLLRRLRAEIRDRFADPSFSASLLAADLGLSRRALHATFQAGGLTFKQELLDIRLAHAKALLEAEEYKRTPMEDIAARAGFANASYFSTIFKKYVGVAPLAYRKIRWS